MKQIHLNNIQSFIVISDVHLRDPKSELTSLFIQTLNDIQTVDAVVLLGDIFDFIAASKDFFLKYWKEVFDAFEALKTRGIRVYLTEGNHDFGFEHFKHSRFDECFTDCGDFEISISHKKYGHILLKHGDDIVCNNSYPSFRRLVKSNFFQKITTAFTRGLWMQFIFSRYAKLSRKRDTYRTLTQRFIDEKISAFLMRKYPKTDIFIMGHIHKDIDHILNLKKPVRLLVGQAWFDTPNLLIVNESQICRKEV